MTDDENEQPLPTALEILHRFYAAERLYMSATPSERNFSGMAAHLSPNVKLHQSPDLPYGGTYTGHEGFQEWSKAMAECFDQLNPSGNPQIFVGEDPSTLMIMGDVEMRVRKTGREFLQMGVQYVRVEREKGWIVDIRPIYWDVGNLRKLLAE